jgi:uncharacterized membrane protein YhaH (DUF805 family)
MNTTNIVFTVGALALAAVNAWNFVAAGSMVTALIWCVAIPIGVLALSTRRSTDPTEIGYPTWLFLIEFALMAPAEKLAQLAGG